MKKYKYIISAGTRIWLRSDAMASPRSIYNDYEPFITEQKMVLDNSDLLVRRHLQHSDMMYLIFRLPKNNRDYDGFEVLEDDVTVIKE